MLLVTNGDSAAEQIERAGLAGVILPWRDVLHEGPVPAGLSARELAEVRARFLADRGWPLETRPRRASLGATPPWRTFGGTRRWCSSSSTTFTTNSSSSRFSGRDLGNTRLSLAAANEYLGNLRPESLRTHFDGRRDATDEELGLASRTWETFRSADPTRVWELLDEDTSALPFLGPALHRQLQQFPSTDNGLSRSEQQALEAISGGKVVLHEAYVASHHDLEEPIFLGDTVFASYLEDLSAAEEPLVVFEDGETIRARARAKTTVGSGSEGPCSPRRARTF